MASVHINMEMLVCTGFSRVGMRTNGREYEPSRAPLLPPLIPTLPVNIASMEIARDTSSPLA
ncbi:hypothetical protein D3C87_1912990 [compost metagenome]